MTERRTPAIIFGGGINGLGVLRNLAREGVPIYCVLESPDPIKYSKYCKTHVILPCFTQRPDSIRSFLSEFPRRGSDRPVVFSTDDRTTLILSNLKDDMKDQYAFVVPDRPVAETLVFKNKFYESLVKEKIDHPRVREGSGDADIRRIGRELGYPVLIRPTVTQDFSEAFVGRKGFVANSETELLDYYGKVAMRNIRVLLQEIVPGSAANIYGIAGCFSRDSHPIALFGYHRVRGWPTLIGVNTLIESVPLRELRSIENTTRAYLDRIGYYGVMEAEFKRDPRNGRYKLLEINARSWWQNSFPTKCGLNVILKAYLDAVGERNPYSETYRAGLKWVNFLDDVAASFSEGEIMKASWIRSLMRVEDHAFFDLRDVAPSIMNMLFEVGAMNSRQGRLRPEPIRSLLRKHGQD